MADACLKATNFILSYVLTLLGIKRRPICRIRIMSIDKVVDSGQADCVSFVNVAERRRVDFFKGGLIGLLREEALDSFE